MTKVLSRMNKLMLLVTMFFMVLSIFAPYNVAMTIIAAVIIVLFIYFIFWAALYWNN